MKRTACLWMNGQAVFCFEKKVERSMYCILIAGVPASGKTTFAAWLSQETGIPYLSKDEIKEILFDTLGFRCREEKVALGKAAEEILYHFAKSQLCVGQPFILENNFDDASQRDIVAILEESNCFPITVLFDGDIETIYQRFIMRDQSPERHRGHVVNTCYPEKGTPAEYIPMGLENFRKGMENRGFSRFHPGGKILRIDCTDFSEVDYYSILHDLNAIIESDNAKRSEII